ncbi:MAG: glycosyltransferase family 2 protein [Endomicrobiales bacterium]
MAKRAVKMEKLRTAEEQRKKRRLRPEIRNLVSIIIPCFNRLAYTRACVRNILRYTRFPYELILIDNGSRDNTPGFLDGLALKLKRRPAPFLRRFCRVLNKENRGVAAALNQGIRRSKGKYLCYLNSDTLVTSGWLEGLARHAGRSRKTGIVGCCSSFTRNGTDLASLPRRELNREIQNVAAFLSLKRRGEYEKARYIHGFCMFIKREVVDDAGYFDEEFHPCCGDDFDYSIRARKAGYRLVIARDVLVYHFMGTSSRSRQFSKTHGAIGAVEEKARRLLAAKWKKEGERCYTKPLQRA